MPSASTNSNLARLTALVASCLRETPRMTPVEWGAKNRVLRPDFAAEPGLWNPERTPYVKAPLNKLDVRDPCQEVVTVFASQTGKTSMIEVASGYIVDVAPASAMFVQPSDDDASDFVTARIDPLIDDCPSLREKFDKQQDKSKRKRSAKILKKGFRGGTFYYRGAGSPNKARSKSVRYLFLDEISAFKDALGKDGNPVALYEKRVTTYGKSAKIYKSSTPTDEKTCRIWPEYLSSDQHKYWVPLPCCGTWQVLDYQHITHATKSPLGVASYHCPHCGAHVPESAKDDFMPRGDWALWIEQADERADALEAISDALGLLENTRLTDVDITWEIVHHPEWMRRAARTHGRKCGYWLSGLYSPYRWLYWDQIIDEHRLAKGDPEAMRVWTNTRLAEVFRGMEGEKVDERNLERLCIPYARPVPDAVRFLTAGADIQADRIELLIAGWDESKAPWHIDHRIIYGDTDQDDVWDELERLLCGTYDGLPISAACIDSGYLTDRVYRFLLRRKRATWWATKGSGRADDPIFPFRATQIKSKAGTNQFRLIGVHRAKKRLMERLQREPDALGCFHFPANAAEWTEDYRDEYFAQFCAEKLIATRHAGVLREEWVKTRARNEILDLWVYAYAAFVGITQNAYKPRERVSAAQAAAPATPPRKAPAFIPRQRSWLKQAQSG